MAEQLKFSRVRKINILVICQYCYCEYFQTVKGGIGARDLCMYTNMAQSNLSSKQRKTLKN